MVHKPIVAHIKCRFFERSETFIYNYIANLKSFKPICLAEEFVNLDLFPYPKNLLFNTSFQKYTSDWLLLKLGIVNQNYKFRKVFKKHFIKLIHAHFGPNGVASLALKAKFKIPLITNFYGYDLSISKVLNEYKQGYEALFKQGDLFLVEGNHMKEKLISLGCPENKAAIQRIAIELNKITFVTRNPKKNGEKVILIFTGRFVEKKGLLYALQALERVRTKNKNFEFRIIGDGILRNEIERYISEHSMSEYVELLGFLNYADYLEEAQKADIFVHPSITASDGDSEGGAPTTILEAQAMGMPIISTFHADIPNIVVPQESALLSKEKNIEDLSKNILYLLENQNYWAKMGKCGRNFVNKYHDINKEAVELEGKYRNLLNNPS